MKQGSLSTNQYNYGMSGTGFDYCSSQTKVQHVSLSAESSHCLHKLRLHIVPHSFHLETRKKQPKSSRLPLKKNSLRWNHRFFLANIKIVPFHLGQNLQEIQVAATMVDQLIFGDQIEEDPSFHLIPTPTRRRSTGHTISKYFKWFMRLQREKNVYTPEN